MNRRMVVVGLIILLIVGVNVSGSINKNKEFKNFLKLTFDDGTLYVGGDGPNNYSKIQDAINDASIGNLIFVYNGIYHEEIISEKRLHIKGENKEKTIIRGNDSLLVGLYADRIIFEGFTVDSTNANTESHGILVKYDISGVTISNQDFCSFQPFSIESCTFNCFDN